MTGGQTQDTQVGTSVPTLHLPNLAVGNRKHTKVGNDTKQYNIRDQKQIHIYICTIAQQEAGCNINNV